MVATGAVGDWEERFSQSKGRSYWFNRATGESVWELPVSSGTVKLKHILIKHRESRRPSSHLNASISRTKEEAEVQCRELLRAIQAGEIAFEEAATKYSDCSSGKRGGDLGLVKRGQMQPLFEEAGFALQKGELSGAVHTDSGVHLIFRYE